MNRLPLKAFIIGAIGFMAINLFQSNLCMESLKAELAVYQASFKGMSDKMLIQKYHEEFDNLRKTFKDSTKHLDIASIIQLPIFKIAVFKSIVKEIKTRQAITNKNFLPSEQIKSADQFIREKEEIMKAGIQSERGPWQKK